MKDGSREGGRRTDPLTKARIVEAAIAILDVVGEGGLTFRSLAAHLATGSGAIYWHVADKDALCEAAVDQVIGDALAQETERDPPRQALRVMALRVYDAIDAHPWIGSILSGRPWQYAALRILEGIGAQLTALGIQEEARFDAATALLGLILGLAGQYAAAARHFAGRDEDRTTILSGIAVQWASLDPVQHPFLRLIATRLPEHDDRRQFLAGIDFVLAGIEGHASRR